MKKFLLLTTSLTACSFLGLTAALANPDGGVVSAGQATIENSTNRVDVRQNSDRAVIDWRSFNINKGETTQFHQPSSSSLTVNRINDANPSQILGNLKANGNVVLINQSGISFGKDAVVDVNSLIATTSDITNADAMAGNLKFNAPGAPDAAIINEGTITAKDAGLVGLVAPRVENNGVINARLGKVHLASGDKFTVDLYGDGAISIAASDDMTEQLVSNSGTINAEGGTVKITAATGTHLVNSLVQLDGEINVPSAEVQGGKIIISGNDETSVSITGNLDASGTTGGSVSITGKNIIQQGRISAAGTNGTGGTGGTVDISFKNAYLDSENSRTDATGGNGDGGKITVKGKTGSKAFVSGKYDASSATDKGGTIQITADQGNLKFFGAQVTADGKTGGGKINVGGEYQGTGSLEHSKTTAVNYSTTLRADATDTGKGGEVIVWSDDETLFGGTAQARGGANGGDGGQIEISSKNQMTISGDAVTSAAARRSGYLAGNLLLDPKNITIANGGISNGISYFELVDPNPDSGAYGGYEVLSNGNVVVIDSEDDLMATDAGAVYLFNGATGALISTLTGNKINDLVGNYGVTELTNGNFVVKSGFWNNGATVLAGAATWGSSTTGVSGVVSSANSIVGSHGGDKVGSNGIETLDNGNYLLRNVSWNGRAGALTWGNGLGGTVGVVSSANSLVGSHANDWVGNQVVLLANGNYVAVSPIWDNGGTANAGAVTWGNGATGTSGVVSAANSLVGSHANDYLGGDQWGNPTTVVLSGSNYLVGSANWDNGAVVNAGALTWGNGLGGTVGVVSSANSLVGSHANDGVGDVWNTVFLSNGNYLALSPNWDNGGAADAGAVTWGSGAAGISGVISSANSLVGSSANDLVGQYGVVELANGNYVVSNPEWDNGGTADVGAVTWGNGTTGTSGAVSAANSLIGTAAGDMVGFAGVVGLTNGNYIVGSDLWDNGATANAGALTWANGTTGLVGTVSAANSLIGATADDRVGVAEALDDGNYVALSFRWHNGLAANAGAVTWGNGTTGTTGIVSAANSMVGTVADSYVGSGGPVSLSGGKYLIWSPDWDDGSHPGVGAVTWIDPSVSTVGVVSAANSLVGSFDYDNIGTGGITVLPNGNYLVLSPAWDHTGMEDVGAVTWGDASTGVFGAIDATNSLIGAVDYDYVGGGGDITILANGNYLVKSPLHDNSGAITWGNASTGVSGIVGSPNSLVGSTANDQIGAWGITTLSNGNYIINSPDWDNGAIVDAGALTWGNGTTGTSGAISSANSVVGSSAGDQVGWSDWGDSVVLSNNDYVLIAPYWDDGAITDAGAVMIIDGDHGTFGEITSYNALLGEGGTIWGGFWPNYEYNEDAVNNRFVVGDSGQQKVYSISLDTHNINDYNLYGTLSSSSITLDPLFIKNVLNAGTSVTLQANNDITVNNDISVSNNFGDGGTFTLQAGRSILLNANIATDNGDLNLFANEDLSTGVVDAQRDAGSAVITMGAGTSINAGTGTVTVRLDDGTGKTNHAGGDVTLRDITAGTILVQNKNTTGDVVLQSGTLTASNAGDSLTLASARNFINNSGAGALSSGGRWLVYSTNPASDTIGGLVPSFRRFSCTYGGSCPALGVGNGLLYSYTPTLTVTPSGLASLNYGDAVPSLAGYAYALSGYLGTDSGDDTIGGSVNGTTTYIVGSGVGSYGVSYSSGNLTSDLGYGFSYANNATAITVDPKDITSSFTGTLSKVYGNANPTLSYANFNFVGLVGSDSASLFTTVTPNFGAVDANTDVGTYAVSATVGGAANYNVTNTPATTMDITTRSLTVTTQPKSKTLPAADPVFAGSNNLTAHDAALISWAYAPVGYGGTAGSYTIDATATDPLSRLANYTRTDAYGTFTVHPEGYVAPMPQTQTSVIPDTVKYMSLGGFLRDIQGETTVNVNESSSSNSSSPNSAPSLDTQLVLPDAEETVLSEAGHDAGF
ncbi:MAG TPA: filamentous hemagglutinin N-terminal domain-containing protein, partial [Alphaproteobacteria bacterium]|nr:filamentous hemagglutinin N-terminal domain-containing protein [Alphaproteobacteria bacterium]